MASERDQVRSGAEEYVDAEIELEQPLDPEQEKALRAAMEQIDPQAFATCDIGAEKISLAYDPTRTNRRAILAAIEQAGGKLKHVETEQSPLL